MPKPKLTLVKSGDVPAATAGDKARAAFSTMQHTYAKYWESPAPHREQVAIAQDLADRENTGKARNERRTVPAAARRRATGEATRERVAQEATKVLDKRPEIHRSALARAVAPLVGDDGITEKYARRVLEELGIPHPVGTRK